MYESTHSDYIRQLHFDLKALSGDEFTARRVLKLREEVLTLSMLDFSPAEATLREGYSPAAGGLAWVRKRYKKKMPTDMKSLLDALMEFRKEHEGDQRD